MDIEGNKKKRSSIGPIIVVLICLGVLGVLAANFISEPKNEAQEAMAGTPKDALDHYLKVADQFVKQQANTNIKDVMDCFPSEDARWFDQNYESLLDVSMRDNIDPTAGGIVDRMRAFMAILESGAYGDGYEMVGERSKDDPGGQMVQYKIQYTTRFGTKIDKVVTLQKQGRYWKVLDMGGGKSAAVAGGIPGGGGVMSAVFGNGQ